MSGRKEGWNASQDGRDAGDAGNTSFGSGRGADGLDAGSVFADEDAELGAPNFHHPCGPRYHHLRDIWEALSRSYLFGIWLFVVLTDRCVRQEVYRKREKAFCSEVRRKMIFGV